MDQLTDNQPISEIEQTICEIDGIEAARIVANGQGLEEIHVLSAPQKNVKRLARDIESALMAKHGLAIDYRKISIAQVSSEDEQIVDTSRLKLKSVSIETSGLSCRVGISLFYNEKDYEGVAQGSVSSSSKRRLVAEATLKALEKACSQASFSLDGLEMVNFGAKSAVCVCISMLNNSSEVVLSGSALRNDGQENEAIVKAVLSALNRRFTLIS